MQRIITLLNLYALNTRHTGVLLAAVGTMLFSFKSIVIKLAFQFDLSAEQLISMRMAISAPIYLGLLLWLQAKSRLSGRTVLNNKWLLLTCGILGYYLASLLDLMGLELISAQLERLILYTYPGFVMLFSWMVWRTKPGTRTTIALLLTWLGILAVMGFESQKDTVNVLLGGGLVLLSAACFGGYLILSKKGIAELGSQAFTCFAMLIASFAVAVHMMLMGEGQLTGIPISAWGYAFVLAVFCTVIPSLLIAAAIGRIGPQHASILGGMGPVVTALFAVLILDEAFAWPHLLGTILVMSGVWLVATEKA